MVRQQLLQQGHIVKVSGVAQFQSTDMIDLCRHSELLGECAVGLVGHVAVPHATQERSYHSELIHPSTIFPSVGVVAGLRIGEVLVIRDNRLAADLWVSEHILHVNGLC